MKGVVVWDAVVKSDRVVVWDGLGAEEGDEKDLHDGNEDSLDPNRRKAGAPSHVCKFDHARVCGHLCMFDHVRVCGHVCKLDHVCVCAHMCKYSHVGKYSHV